MTDRVYNLATGDVDVVDAPAGRPFRRAQLARRFAAALTGLSVYELPPGEGEAWPYHFDLGREEWLIVIAGTPTLRTPDGQRRLRPGDIVCFPPGPGGAHAVRNEGDDVARLAMPSSVSPLGQTTVYPDSGKVTVVGPGFERTFALRPEVDHSESDR